MILKMVIEPRVAYIDVVLIQLRLNVPLLQNATQCKPQFQNIQIKISSLFSTLFSIFT